MKKSKTKAIKKNEFRTNKKTGHPSYIFEKVGEKFKFIGITHSKITDGVKNIKLEKNPNPVDSRSAYMRPKTSEDKTNNFKRKKEGWRLSARDKTTAKKIIEDNKKRTTRHEQ